MLDIPVSFVSPEAPETRPEPGEGVESYVTRLALSKAKEVALKKPSSIVISADTVVVLEGTIIGKPSNTQEAVETLEALSGKIHQVVTGMAVIDPSTGEADTVTRSTIVAMRRYTGEEIAHYSSRGEPFDKAGGYAVQDPIFNPCERLDGCYLNVVGLPLCDMLALLRRIGVDVTTEVNWRRTDECASCPI